MKQLIPFLLAGMLASPVWAQQSVPHSASQPEFIVAPSVPQHYNQLITFQTQTTLDTLDQYLKRSTGFGVYSYPVQTPNGVINLPITGTNNIYRFLGSKYDFSGKATLYSVLVVYASKSIQGSPDTFTASIFSLPSTSFPVMAQLGSQEFYADQIDTNSAQPMFTVIDFENPVPISTNFAVMIRTINVSEGADLDSVAIYSSQNGDGKGEKRACIIAVNEQNELYNADLADLFNTDAGPIDIDPIIIPVLDMNTTGVDDYLTLNGLTLKGAFPNPASNNTSIQFVIDKPSSVEINIIDMTGRIVSTVHQNTMEAGNHALHLDLMGLPTGSYMYTLSTEIAHVAGKFTVTK